MKIKVSYKHNLALTFSLHIPAALNLILKHFMFNVCSVCVNGSLMCTDRPCPMYGAWSSWSECSVSCGTGQRTRTRTCKHTPGGPSCKETIQSQNCTLLACPGVLKYMYLHFTHKQRYCTVCNGFSAIQFKKKKIHRPSYDCSSGVFSELARAH